MANTRLSSADHDRPDEREDGGGARHRDRHVACDLRGGFLVDIILGAGDDLRTPRRMRREYSMKDSLGDITGESPCGAAHTRRSPQEIGSPSLTTHRTLCLALAG